MQAYTSALMNKLLADAISARIVIGSSVVVAFAGSARLAVAKTYTERKQRDAVLTAMNATPESRGPVNRIREKWTVRSRNRPVIVDPLSFASWRRERLARPLARQASRDCDGGPAGRGS
ncbi:hypothetical protein [Bosea vestrisii]|uniref:Uncharacterized protein n=1 Tax=Bosea vestrisii TaxID=151416 RepID=A0ABW0HBI5_9HYPH